MEFDCTKPLGENLETYLNADINSICSELKDKGIVYEHQFSTLWSMVCKHNALELTELFSKRTGLDIFYQYDNVTCNFVFYDTDVHTRQEAIRKSIEYQK